MAHIELERPDDKTLVVLVGGIEIATLTHDEHGWVGLETAERVARGIGRELYVDVEEK